MSCSSNIISYRDIRSYSFCLSKFKVYVTSQDPSMETGFDPDMNRRRPQNPDRPLPTSRTSRGIDRSAFSIGKNCAAKNIKISAWGNMKLLIYFDEYCFNICLQMNLEQK